MTRKVSYIIAIIMLALMFGLAFFSMLGDSAIMDEVAHLPAGYSYIEKMDMRLNPEHPPLVKDLAGGMVWLWSKASGQKINFPENLQSWQTDINGQWNFGFNFLYNSGNNADKMLLLGRLPVLFIMLLLGFYIFKWTRELFGNKTALLALFLYSFSPTFIAHSRFVTTDVAAATAIFISSYYFIRWLKNPNAKNLIIAGLVFGVAQLAKFSVFLLIPLFVFISIVWIILKTKQASEVEHPIYASLAQNIWRYFGGLIAICAIGYIFIVWPIYFFHIAHYPIERQIADTKFTLASFGMRPIANLIIWLAGIPVFRAIAQYGLGMAMVLQRAAGGNTTYFLGEISATGSRIYFPFVYLVKETISLHILTLIALITVFFGLIKNKTRKTFSEFLGQNIEQFLMLSFIALYWFSSVKSPLNIGVRHILPTFPLIFILVSRQIGKWLNFEDQEALLWKDAIRKIISQGWLYILKITFVTFLIIWQIASVIFVYPSFLSYFNESIGGQSKGYIYVTDSNLDWGQDLKRLSQWTNENNINRIFVDYFGGAVPSYYLGNKYRSWSCGMQTNLLKNQWLAVSATFLQGGRGKPALGYKDSTGCYNWLNDYQPVTTIGNSIFIYHIN